ncbi:MAG TPA: lytic transglycosylase domain-containing protein [Chthoniobacterales bacterium]|jgi:soluble lytic murein transglycosylase|nr:lytic transglycosylase domain-containing protein [Chthoniobacterales bacterium]
MARFLLKVVICAFLAGAAGLAYLSMRSGDTVYTLYEWISPARFQQHDALIRAVAAEHQVDPMLVKAVIWRESRFDSHKFGNAGERGLMQVSEIAAGEWAREAKKENFRVEELFDPKTNVEAGTWYLRRAIGHWQNQADPVPFALAEYNAGASRALRWAGGDDTRPVTTKTFLATIDFPGTRKYVDSIMARYEFYKRRGRM